jgi:dehydrogenase/reductase SDR family member 12
MRLSGLRSRALADAALDRAVLPGYSRIGYALRSRWWQPLPRMDGRSVLVTGASAGIGEAAAAAFVRLGARVHILGRDPERTERARGATGAARAWPCDLSSLRSVRELARRFRDEERELHVLVNNAGVLMHERRLSADGNELALATNVLGPFLLTGLLAGMLDQAAPGRVINVSSGGMYTQRVPVDDLQSERGYDGPAVYARHKRAQVVLTELWAERLAERGVRVHSMHPGWVDTPGLERSLPRFRSALRPLLRTPEQGADTIVWLGAAPEPAESSGRFWHDRAERPTHLLPRTRETPEERRRLWGECIRLTGLELA